MMVRRSGILALCCALVVAGCATPNSLEMPPEMTDRSLGPSGDGGSSDAQGSGKSAVELEAKSRRQSEADEKTEIPPTEPGSSAGKKISVSIRIGEAMQAEGEEGKSSADAASDNDSSASLAAYLQDAMSASGRWEAVDIASTAAADSGLMVSGKVLDSPDGGVRLHIRAVDANGTSWLDKRYSDASGPGKGTGVQKTVYERIADDLGQALGGQSEDDLEAIHQGTAQRGDIARLTTAEGALLSARGDYVKAVTNGALSRQEDKDYRGYLAQLKQQVEITCLELRHKGINLDTHAQFCSAAFDLTKTRPRQTIAQVPAAQPAAGKQTSRKHTGASRPLSGAGSGGSLGANRTVTAPGARAHGAFDGIPADIPDGQDDDVVARQLREAAMVETDPELKKQMWQEYKTYKRGLRRQNNLNKMLYHYSRNRG